MKIPLVVKAFAVAIPLGVTFVDFVGYVARVEGVSMRPSLNPVPGQVDFVFLNKWALKHHGVSRGEIIALISPRNPDQRFIKRVVGLEGDMIPSTNYKKGFVTVPSGHCWVEDKQLQTEVEATEQFMTAHGSRLDLSEFGNSFMSDEDLTSCKKKL